MRARSEVERSAASSLESCKSYRVGLLSKEVEKCKVESSAYAWIGQFVTERLLMNKRKRVGDRTELCGTPLKVTFHTLFVLLTYFTHLLFTLLTKLPSFDFYPSLYSFISSFLSGRSISPVEDGQCSSPKPINRGVPQGSILSPTLFILLNNDLSIANCSIH